MSAGGAALASLRCPRLDLFGGRRAGITYGGAVRRLAGRSGGRALNVQARCQGIDAANHVDASFRLVVLQAIGRLRWLFNGAAEKAGQALICLCNKSI